MQCIIEIKMEFYDGILLLPLPIISVSLTEWLVGLHVSFQFIQTEKLLQLAFLRKCLLFFYRFCQTVPYIILIIDGHSFCKLNKNQTTVFCDFSSVLCIIPFKQIYIRFNATFFSSISIYFAQKMQVVGCRQKFFFPDFLKA